MRQIRDLLWLLVPLLLALALCASIYRCGPGDSDAREETLCKDPRCTGHTGR